MTNIPPPKQRRQTAKRKLRQDAPQKAFIWCNIAPYPYDIHTITHLSPDGMAAILRRHNTSRKVRKSCQHGDLVSMFYQALRGFTDTYCRRRLLRRIIRSHKKNICHYPILINCHRRSIDLAFPENRLRRLRQVLWWRTAIAGIPRHQRQDSASRGTRRPGGKAPGVHQTLPGNV